MIIINIYSELSYFVLTRVHARDQWEEIRGLCMDNPQGYDPRKASRHYPSHKPIHPSDNKQVREARDKCSLREGIIAMIAVS